MPDIADEACIHLIAEMRRTGNRRVEWCCSDCGRVFSWIELDPTMPLSMKVDLLWKWAAKNNIPQRKVNRFLDEVPA